MFILNSVLSQTSPLISCSSPLTLAKFPSDLVFDLNNPLILISLIIVSLLAILFILNIYIIRQGRLHNQNEKKELLDHDTKLMAVFAELDPEPVFRFDNSGIILMTNEAGFKLSNNGGLVGKELNSIIPEIIDFDLGKCIKDGEQIDFISNIKDKCFRFTMKGIPDLNIGQIYGSNITTLKETEDKLSFALTTAEKSEKIKTFFLAQISHEIRSPLTAIMGYNSIIKDEVANKITKELEYAFDAIDYSSRRLKRTIDQILNMSLLQTGKYDSHFEPVDMVSIIKEIIVEYNQDIKQKNLNLNFTNAADDVLINADRYSIIQIFSNIIDNAVKYTKKGGIEIIIGRDQFKRLFISVVDTGIGMSEDYIKNIFVPFTQETMGYSRPFEGSGLGMTLIKRFSELNDAEVDIQSAKNNGTKLKITFNN
jgi:signal transduction histidine kinase